MGQAAPVIIAAAVSTGAAVAENRQRRKAQAAEIRRQNVLAARERRKIARDARLRRAEIQQTAIASGSVGASSEVTSISATTSNEASNLSFLNTITGIDRDISNANQRAQNFRDLGDFSRTLYGSYKDAKGVGLFT